MEAGRVQVGQPALIPRSRLEPTAGGPSGVYPLGPLLSKEKNMSLSHEQLQDIAKQLHEAENNRTMIPRLTATYPEMTVEDSYAVQGQWVQRKIDDG